MIADVDLTGGLETAWEHVVTFAPKLLGFFLILLIGYFIAKAISKLVDSLLERVGFDGWVEHGSASVGADPVAGRRPAACSAGGGNGIVGGDAASETRSPSNSRYAPHTQNSVPSG